MGPLSEGQDQYGVRSDCNQGQREDRGRALTRSLAAQNGAKVKAARTKLSNPTGGIETSSGGIAVADTTPLDVIGLSFRAI